MYKFSNKSLERLNTVDQRLIDLFTKVIEVSPIDFGIAEGLRDAETQNRYYKEGKSKLDGYNKKSKHQDGKAIDIYAYVNGKASWDKVHIAIIIGVIFAIANQMNIKIKSGATFGSDEWLGWDFPHIQLEE